MCVYIFICIYMNVYIYMCVYKYIYISVCVCAMGLNGFLWDLDGISHGFVGVCLLSPNFHGLW